MGNDEISSSSEQAFIPSNKMSLLSFGVRNKRIEELSSDKSEQDKVDYKGYYVDDPSAYMRNKILKNINSKLN